MSNVHELMENEDIVERLIRRIQSSGPARAAKIFKEFAEIIDLSGKVDFIEELLTEYNILPHYIKDYKNNEKSSELRKNGNNFFSRKNDEKALELYTYSIAFAENGSENLGLAYGNRSAVLYSLGLFEECLQDIKRALENKYPESLKHKINSRREKALKLQPKQKKILYYQEIPQIDAKNKNPMIECASNCVRIENDPKQGRYLVATRNIEIGEIIAVESPVFSVLNDSRWCHCYHCLTLCYNLTPCELCTKALFCSSHCKNVASDYHKYECPILATIESFGYNSCRLLPLRIAICVKDTFVKEIQIQETDATYKSGCYKEIHNLITNQEHRTQMDIFERLTCTALFYKILRDYSDFFKSNTEDIFISLLFRHLQTMACNFHNINELSLDLNGIYESDQVGSGAYSFLSLFNHSCAPNVCRSSYGTKLCVSAIETIKEGDQLFDNYGFHFAVHPKSKRQVSLKKQYYFDCECRACSSNWDTVFNLKCLNEPIPLVEFHEKLAKADLEVAKRIRPLIIKAMKELEENIPCFEFFQEQEMLKQCDSIFGNVRRSFSDTYLK